LATGPKWTNGRRPEPAAEEFGDGMDVLTYKPFQPCWLLGRSLSSPKYLWSDSVEELASYLFQVFA